VILVTAFVFCVRSVRRIFGIKKQLGLLFFTVLVSAGIGLIFTRNQVS